MIQNLTIKNYAIIEKSEIQFNHGFSVITGETGAGKSILLDALGLILGQRADLKSLRNKDEKCIIEATFDVSNYNLQSFYEINDLDFESKTIIRREILPSGKSRAFINDTPTTLTTLQSLGKNLLDIHSQHQTHELFDEKYQLNLLDTFANAHKEHVDYNNKLKKYKELQKTLENLQAKQGELIKEHDYNSFLFNELEDLSLKEGEDEKLQEEEQALSNVEKITENLSAIHKTFTNDNYSVINQLKEANNYIQRIKNTHSDYEEWSNRIESSVIELEDLSMSIEQKLENTIADPTRLDEVQDRLQNINLLFKKHQVSSINDLLIIQEELSTKVLLNDSIVNDIEQVTIALTTQKKELNISADKLTKKRVDASKKLIPILESNIKPLGMPNAQFKFDIQKSEKYLAMGQDKLTMMFSANKGMGFGDLKKSASGGELSRIMLVIKALLASKSNLPTLIFDEIDTGVSGEIANKMADIMKVMSSNMQLFSITHLAQVASKGTYHYKVFKHEVNGKTISEIIPLNKQQRVNEIAQMISGIDITQAALQQAESLLN